jgi:hypothetical protein
MRCCATNMQHTDLSVGLGESLATSTTTPPSDAQLIAWARDQANRIINASGAAGEAAQALEFLKRYVGPNSDFYEAATRLAAAIIDLPNSVAAHQARGPLATVLTSWADFQGSGLAAAPPFGVAARVEAADDLVDQASQTPTITSVSTTSASVSQTSRSGAVCHLTSTPGPSIRTVRRWPILPQAPDTIDDTRRRSPEAAATGPCTWAMKRVASWPLWAT